MLYWTYQEALKAAPSQTPSPTFEQCLVGEISCKNLDLYWQQYIQEVGLWYEVLQKYPQIRVNEIKFSKTHQSLLCELTQQCDFDAGSGPVKFQALHHGVDFVVYAIVAKLAQKSYASDLLPQSTWDRHALLTEITANISNLYIYKHKNFSEDLKRKWFMCILTIVDALVDAGVLVRELIVQNGYELAGLVNLTADADGLMPEAVRRHEMKDSKPNKYKTVYLYYLKQSIVLNFGSGVWNASLLPFQTIVFPDKLIYLKAITFTSIHRVTLENKYSNRYFWLEDLTILEKLQQLQVHINEDLYETVFKELTKNSPPAALAELLEQITMDLKQLSKPVRVPRAGTGGDAGVPDDWRVDWKKTKARAKRLQKSINKNLILLDFIMIKKCTYLFGRPIYFPATLDFRGRIYLKSRISPQASHVFRYIYDYGPLHKDEPLCEKYMPIDYDRWFQYIQSHLVVPRELDSKNRRLVFWLVVELAKLVKGRYVNKYGGSLSIGQFIELGVSVYLQKTGALLELDKRIQYNYIMHVLNEVLAHRRLLRDYIVYKDATASAIQLLTLLLQPAQGDIKRYANLSSQDTWYDTYYYIIEIFLRGASIGTDSRPYFTREFLKKTIMTYNYAATLYTCWNEFKESVKEVTIEQTAAFWSTLREDFEKFYKFLNHLFNERTLFVDSIDAQADKWVASFPVTNEIVLKSNDHAKIYFHYFVPKTRRLTVKVEQARKTLQINSLSSELDLKKTRQAIKPNTTHALDATLVRETLRDLNKPIVTIHDCFGINAYSIDLLLASINKNIGQIYLQNLGGDKRPPIDCFSIFIVL